MSPAPTPGVANGARYVVALPFSRGANGGTRGTRSTSPYRRGSVDKCSRPSRSVAIAGVRRAVTRYPQVPRRKQGRPRPSNPPAPALVVPRCCVREFRVARTCAPHLAGALVVVGWAAPLRAGLIAELGDGAAGRPGKRCQWCRAVPDHPRPPLTYAAAPCSRAWWTWWAALARPLAAGTSAVPGGAELVGLLRP